LREAIETTLVKDWMSSPVVSVSPITSIGNAHQILKERGIRRLPVIDRNKLVGIITIGDVREASPSDATSLSIWELNYLWGQITVEKVMSRDVITVEPDAPIVEAARLMLENKVSGLPVIDPDSGAVVGILTESDVFRMLVGAYDKTLA